ncbi:hypothetical protein CU097_002432, partial [Rhizopus azygosporus]
MEHITNINENLLLNEFALKIRTQEAERRRDNNNEFPSSIISEMEETPSADM